LADTHRIPQLDGLRGIAALIVVIFHFLLALKPSVLPDPLAFASGTSPAATSRLFWLADSPIGIFFNGNFAVYLFFVLSGFVVSNAAASTSSPVYVNVFFRYLRLSIPATASIILAWVLLRWFPDEVRSLNAVLPHKWLGFISQSPVPPLSFALTDGLIDIFKDGFSGLNVVLWTMKIELLGSLSIYLIYGLVKSRHVRLAVVVLAILSCVLFYPLRMYFGFALGVGLREAWVAKIQVRYAAAALFAGILLGFPEPGFMERVFGLEHLRGALSVGDRGYLVSHVAALLIVYGALYSKSAVRCLTTAPIQFLGRFSFPLYLVHVPILFTVITAIYLAVTPSPLMLGVLFFMFLLLSIGAACLFEISIDAPLLAALSLLKRRWRP
jgi:peptidoglycan/LPS O-acetylase OafA/YrhL